MHLVLRDGYPLTEKIKRFPIFCDKEGRLSFSRPLSPCHLKISEKRVLAEEIRAQISRCRNYGMPLTHIDSHYHTHAAWDIATVLISIARQENIIYIRIRENCGVDLPFGRAIKNYIFNYRLRIAGFARTKYFGHLRQIISLKRRLNSLDALRSLEIAIHPKINDSQNLVNMVYDTEDDLEKQIKEIDSYKESVSFSGVRIVMLQGSIFFKEEE
jgi:predicted glycoside hydrolase/deacetylase ChbG (UPF0249 family)